MVVWIHFPTVSDCIGADAENNLVRGSITSGASFPSRNALHNHQKQTWHKPNQGVAQGSLAWTLYIQILYLLYLSLRILKLPHIILSGGNCRFCPVSIIAWHITTWYSLKYFLGSPLVWWGFPIYDSGCEKGNQDVSNCLACFVQFYIIQMNTEEHILPIYQQGYSIKKSHIINLKQKL